MSKPQNDGGQAFPFHYWQSPNGMIIAGHEPGMALRDWLAGQALPAIIAATASGQHNPVPPSKANTPADIDAGIARNAYALADAMLAERSKQ